MRLAALGLSAAALVGSTAAPAQADDGSVTLPGPGGCDVTVWWDTTSNPMAGATVPHYSACLKPVYDAIGS